LGGYRFQAGDNLGAWSTDRYLTVP
jgi:hypothetical protein